jgi:hypothetical protein
MAWNGDWFSGWFGSWLGDVSTPVDKNTDTPLERTRTVAMPVREMTVAMPTREKSVPAKVRELEAHEDRVK